MVKSNESMFKVICFFAVCVTICLTAIEISSMAFLQLWNNEIFSAITGLTGLVVGSFIGRKAFE